MDEMSNDNISSFLDGTITTSSSAGNSDEKLSYLYTSCNNNYGLIIETKTWSRDSHELFDYESPNITTKKFLVCRNSKLFRQNTECLVSTNDEEVPNYGDYLLTIRFTSDGKYIALPADRNIGVSINSNERQLTPKKVWIIVRDLPSQSYTLQPNDLIKLGRFKLRVKQLVRNGDKIPELRLDEMDTNIVEATKEEAQTMQCRICLTEGEQEDDPLLCPCQCRGSIKFVHLECLRHWINGRLNLVNENSPTDTFFFRQLQCELCKSPLPSSASIKGARINIVKVPITKAPFIVLENLYGNAYHGVHVISMAEKKNLKLGRGHESDVRISDVSISRYHATIRYINDNFILEDHASKFGTLVAIRKPQIIESGKNVSLQVGRTVVNLQLSDEPCIQNTYIKDLPLDNFNNSTLNGEYSNHPSHFNNPENLSNTTNNLGNPSNLNNPNNLNNSDKFDNFSIQHIFTDTNKFLSLKNNINIKDNQNIYNKLDNHPFENQKVKV